MSKKPDHVREARRAFMYERKNGKSVTQALVSAIEASEAAKARALPRWRHVKRGSVYVEVGIAQLQLGASPLADYESMVVYRGSDRQLWVRPEVDFRDGRFELVNPEE
jgi:hypothetical protein